MPEIFEGYDPDMSGDLSNAGGILGAIFGKKDKDKNKDKDKGNDKDKSNNGWIFLFIIFLIIVVFIIMNSEINIR